VLIATWVISGEKKKTQSIKNKIKMAEALSRQSEELAKKN